MGMMGSLGMMGGNPLTSQGMMQSMLAMRSPSLDMNNPVLTQLMMQQAMSMSQTGAPQVQKLMGMYPGVYWVAESAG
ncbi:hypothetical protein Pcinc_038448 [Petrolisthes cinctipes]|uniref:Uncharacterized protein n=1 Tax=Petrolisthes cinctipes TaxID=88211 RepID=A0AAE1BTM0_PETCI|nr:hypothetical protein Pcinc_038448 [Petrolisthes cinctipes]